LTISEASFLGLIFETFFYSIFLVVLGCSLYLQWERGHDRSAAVHKPVLVFSLLLGVLMSVHWALNVWNAYAAFMTLGPGIQREVAFGDLSEKRILTMLILYEVQVWMGDAILVWRLWLVSGKNVKLVAFPVVTCTALLVASCGFLHACARSKLTDPASLWLVRKWVISAFAISIFENVFCASLITWQIWKSQHNVRNAAQDSSTLTPIARIFIECAALWIIAGFCTFMAYLADNYVYFIFYYIAAPVLGISFCLMTVRLNLRTRSPPISSLGSGSSARASGSSASRGYSSSGSGARKVALDPTSSLDAEQDGDDASKIQLGPVQLGESKTKGEFASAGV